MKKAIVLLSGGLDSATCLGLAIAQGFHCHALSFNYGQRHHVELNAAKLIAAHFNVTHHIFDLNIHQFGGSALTDKKIAVPDYDENNSAIPVTYVPARNTIFLSIALAQAEVIAAQDIFIGISSVDYSGYPDCRPEYLQAFQNLANLATKSGMNTPITIHAPLVHLSKGETIRLGQDLGVDYTLTVSCYRANQNSQACGTCESCMLRKKGFREAQTRDITPYYSA